MKSVIASILVVLTGCTVTVAPIKQSTSSRGHRQSHAKSHTKPTDTRTNRSDDLVDATWLVEYHRLEKEHGGYEIPKDKNIKAEGAKFRVPKEVITHFEDLQNTQQQ